MKKLLFGLVVAMGLTGVASGSTGFKEDFLNDGGFIIDMASRYGHVTVDGGQTVMENKAMVTFYCDLQKPRIAIRFDNEFGGDMNMSSFAVMDPKLDLEVLPQKSGLILRNISLRDIIKLENTGHMLTMTEYNGDVLVMAVMMNGITETRAFASCFGGM